MTEPAAVKSYRADIDGLRAFAVISVILYHFNNNLLPSGFLGVDVFFVISGFVVTGSVLRSQTSSPARDLVHFWKRRWLRIAPPLIVCVFVSTIVAGFLFAPIPRTTYIGTLRTGVAALFGLGNLYLYRIRLDYFQADQSINIFSHTWSLGVEEQFYVAFSIVAIWLLPFLFPRHRSRARIGLFAIATLLSLFVFAARPATDAIANYYFFSSRLWELGIGCVLACVASESRTEQSPLTLHIIQIMAAAALLGAVLHESPVSTFPTGPIVVGVVAAAALIGSGSMTTPVISTMLASRATVIVGLLSYSLYLWHWPILVFFRYTVGLRSLAPIAAAAIITALASFGSYRFVEQKWRRTRKPFLRKLAPQFATALITTVLMSGFLQSRPGIFYLGKDRHWAQWLPQPDFIYGLQGRVTQQGCLLHNGSPLPGTIPPECVSPLTIASGKASQTLFVVGDSHAFADWGMAAYGNAIGAYTFATLAHDDCSANATPSTTAESCRQYWNWIPEQIRKMHRGDAVLVSFLWYYYDDASYESGIARLRNIIAAADSAGVNVIVEAPLPHFDRPAFTCSEEWYRTDYEGCSISRSQFEAGRRTAMSDIAAVGRISGNVRVWDPIDILCSDRCSQFRGDKAIYRDANHLSFTQSQAMGPAFLKFVTGP
jgi:peptidoglycan/LPS O-acetylase OafA/YrhL